MNIKEKTFTLNDLDEAFWESVIFIKIRHSSGLGGPGRIWIATCEKKVYFIGFEGFPYNERRLEEFSPILKRKEKIEDYNHPYAMEEDGWKYIINQWGDKILMHQDFYDTFIKTPESRMFDIALRRDEEWERFDYEESVKIRKEKEQMQKSYEETRKTLKLTSDYFEWKPIHPNNLKSNKEVGLYSLIFRENEGKVMGYKFSIIYQREQISPLCYHGDDSKIELYNLYEMRYDDVQGSLHYADHEKYEDALSSFALTFDAEYTFNDHNINSYGEFVRSFKTLGEAQEYAVTVSNIRQYADKETIIRNPDDPVRECKNRLRKYEALIEFRNRYEEILKVVCEYEFPSESSGGGFIVNEVLDKTGIDKETLKEMWEYVPLILTNRTQRNAQKIVEECKAFLEKQSTPAK